MAKTVPTLSDFRARFAELATVGDTVINTLLTEATNYVEPELWADQDYALAILYLVAHIAQLVKVSASGGGSAQAGEIYVSSVRFADRSLSYGVAGGAVGTTRASQYDSTIYGRMFLSLRARNIIGVMVV